MDNDELKKNLNEEIIRKNINLDFSRKTVLENILDNYKEYIFSNKRNNRNP